MSFVNIITGQKSNIDKVAEKYLSKYEVQLEYAPAQVKAINTLYPYVEQNPYREQFTQAEELTELFGKPKSKETEMTAEDGAKFISWFEDLTKESSAKVAKYQEQISLLQDKLGLVLPFKSVNYNMEEILGFKNIKFRFGRIPADNFVKFTDYAQEDLDSLFLKADEDEKYVWGIYFVTEADKDRVDAAYTSLHFERTFIPSDVHGTPDEAVEDYEKQIKALEESIDREKAVIAEKVESSRAEYEDAYNALRKHAVNFDIRKYAACTKEDGKAYFILSGWTSTEDARKLKEDIEKNEKEIICIVDDKHTSTDSVPPTKLKNPKLARPFEMFIRMYGIPAYNEIDPTIFVAITYAFIFGAMFGDVGQGLCLFIGGILLYKFKKMDLAAIIAEAGFFSTIFGFLYGSVFGFENILNHLWLSPKQAMTKLPFVGRLNTVFVVTIAFGMAVILIAMIMHIINAIKAKDLENKFFDANGLAGLVFYGALVTVVVLYMSGNKLPAGIVLIVLFVVPLILIALKEPLTHIIQKKKAIEGSVGMFATQTFFEMFEVLLSYFSNTLSFIRIGAFAVSHAAMMEVVLMLAGAEDGGTGNIIVIIIGNIIVCGLEGLIVGIQVLRLEYYEIFSRFYKGTGREFKPFGDKTLSK